MPSAKLVPPHFSGAENIPDAGWSQPAGWAAGSPTAGSQPATKSLGLVYIVENDPISAVITRLIVEKNLIAGKIRCYTNGQLAFDDLTLALRDGVNLPDLIMLDLDMPLMDGWEFLDALAELALLQPIRVFVLTSSIYPDDLPKVLNYKGVRGFFPKPLKEEGVARMLSLLQEA